MNKTISVILIATLSFVLIGCEKKSQSSMATSSTETTAAQTSEAPAVQGSEADKLYDEGNNYHNKGEIDKAFAAFSKASELGSVCAPFFIGIIYENGEGGRQADMKQALEWYEKASSRGCVEATKRIKLLTKKH